MGRQGIKSNSRGGGDPRLLAAIGWRHAPGDFRLIAGRGGYEPPREDAVASHWQPYENSRADACLSPHKIETIGVHHLGPGGDEVMHELLLRVGAAIDLGEGAKLRM
jgi:hypothetical protein